MVAGPVLLQRVVGRLNGGRKLPQPGKVCRGWAKVLDGIPPVGERDWWDGPRCHGRLLGYHNNFSGGGANASGPYALGGVSLTYPRTARG